MALAHIPAAGGAQCVPHHDPLCSTPPSSPAFNWLKNDRHGNTSSPLCLGVQRTARSDGSEAFQSPDGSPPAMSTPGTPFRIPSRLLQTHRRSPQHSAAAKIPEFASVQRSRWLPPYPASRWHPTPLQGPKAPTTPKIHTPTSNWFPTWTPLSPSADSADGSTIDRYPLSLARFV